MIKALVIDDEESMRDAVRILGNWALLNIDIILEASNGAEGLDLMRQENPDIVLVDMKMPLIDGSAFLKKARSEFPNSKYIIVSGYDDFAYVKNAIQSNALDYILKPVDQTELNKVLSRAVKEIMIEKFEYCQKKISQIFQCFSQSEIIKGVYLSLLSKKDLINVDISKGNIFFIALLEVTNYSTIFDTNPPKRSKVIYTELSRSISELFNPLGWCLVFGNIKRRNEIILTLGIEDSASSYINAIENYLISISNLMTERFNLHSIVGVGSAVKNQNELFQSLEVAERIIKTTNLLYEKDRIILEPEGSEELTRNSLLNKGEVLIKAFESRNTELVKAVINEYYTEIVSSGYFSFGDALKSYDEFQVIIKNLGQILKAPEKSELDQVLLNGQKNILFSNFKDFKKKLDEIILSALEIFNKGMITINKTDIYEIKKYIDKSYYNQIDLKFFSDKYHFSKEYISKVFKAEFGYGIHEYLLKTRMEKATDLLKNNNLKIKDIASMVGYSNSNYFSKAFKNYTGYSPANCRDLRFKS